jgi:hypothetical protein
MKYVLDNQRSILGRSRPALMSILSPIERLQATFSQWVTQRGREAVHSAPSRAKVTNGYKLYFPVKYSWHGT